MLTDDWFIARQVCDSIWAIEDPGQVTSYLVIGRVEAVLVDTGLGIGDIAKLVFEICGALPRWVLNTHHHFDHVGGNPLFDKCYMLPAEASAIPRSWPTDMFQRYVSKPARFSRPLPPLFARENYYVEPPKGFHALKDCMVFDLGRVSIEVIATPGHTPGSASFLVHPGGCLLSGDFLMEGTLHLQYPYSDLDAYIASCERIAIRLSEISSILPSHYRSPIPGNSLVGETHKALTAIIDGKIEPKSVASYWGMLSEFVYSQRLSVWLPGNA